jgi:hypothetical protein
MRFVHTEMVDGICRSSDVPFFAIGWPSQAFCSSVMGVDIGIRLIARAWKVLVNVSE